jgi:hypothetical protein
MQTSHPTYDAGSCLNIKELGADIVSIVYQRTPTLALLLGACGWRIVLLGLTGRSPSRKT